MVFIPLRDYNPLRRISFQAVNVALIAATVAAFLWQMSLLPEAGEAAIYAYGVVPAALAGGAALGSAPGSFPAEATLLTSIFLHGGLMHLAGNMLYLWIFGDNVEDAMGHGRYLVFYLLCGVAAAGAQIASDPASPVPMIGASGAISGVLGAYLMLHPRTQVLVAVFGRMLTRLPAVIVLGLWIALQFVSAAVEGSRTGGGTAWWAHIGGFAAGIVLVVPLRARGVKLFDRGPLPAGRGWSAARSRIPESGGSGR